MHQPMKTATLALAGRHPCMPPQCAGVGSCSPAGQICTLALVSSRSQCNYLLLACRCCYYLLLAYCCCCCFLLACCCCSLLLLFSLPPCCRNVNHSN
jgi:hypothetical protein